MEVEHAVLTGDADSLRNLYAQAVEIFGSSASTEWAQALSAYDATAVTG